MLKFRVDRRIIFNRQLYRSTFFMPRIGSFELSIRINYKLDLNHVIPVAVNKHVFGKTYLRVTSTCSQYIAAVNSFCTRVSNIVGENSEDL